MDLKMTTYSKVNVPLIGGKNIPSVLLGEGGASIILAPSGLSGTTPATWTEDLSKSSIIGGSGTSVGTNLGFKSLRLNPQANASLSLSSFSFPSTGFTACFVGVFQNSVNYFANLGQYKIAVVTVSGKYGVQMERSGGTSTAQFVGDTTKTQVVVLACDGANTKIYIGSSVNTNLTSGLTDTASTVLSPWIGRSNPNATTDMNLFALWPKVLNATQAQAVIRQQIKNFPGVQ